MPDGDEVNAINLSYSRIDHDPEIAALLRRSVGNGVSAAMGMGNGAGLPHVWAVFAPENAYLFRSRSEREKIEWILRIDEGYFSSAGASGEVSEAE